MPSGLLLSVLKFMTPLCSCIVHQCMQLSAICFILFARLNGTVMKSIWTWRHTYTHRRDRRLVFELWVMCLSRRWMMIGSYLEFEWRIATLTYSFLFIRFRMPSQCVCAHLWDLVMLVLKYDPSSVFASLIRVNYVITCRHVCRILAAISVMMLINLSTCILG